MKRSTRNTGFRPFRRYRTNRESVLAAWRGVDVSELQVAREENARPVHSFLDQVMRDVGLDRKRSEAEIAKVWNNLIDPAITAQAQPTGLRKGTLFVSVTNNVWLSEIVRYRRREILQRLQHSFGREVVQRISFRVG